MVYNSKNNRLNPTGGRRDIVVGGAATPTTYPATAGNTEPRGAPPSNTAPANCTDSLSGTTILRTGIDSLYVSCRGQISDKTEALLSNLKDLAQAQDPDERARAVFQIGDHRFQVMDKGKGRFAYVLADNWFHLQVASRTATSLPMVYCQIRSELLSCEGPKAALMELALLLGELSGFAADMQVSRVDLCADFITSVELGDMDDNCWVTRAAGRNRYSKHDVFTGLMFGAGGDVSARLYDKTREITEQSKKFFFYSLWSDRGWDAKSPVWRLEFQFRRPVLAEFDVIHVYELLSNLGSLWEYACGSWLRLTIASDDNTSSRWPLHPLWECLRQADWGQITRSLWRVRKDRVPGDEFLYINGLAGLSSFMAKEGITDVEIAMKKYMAEAIRFHARRTLTDDKALERYLNIKAKEKATRYNKPLPGVEEGKGDAS